MLLFMGLIVAKFMPDWIFKPMNENPNITPVQTRSCTIIKDTSDSWLKNDKYKCD